MPNRSTIACCTTLALTAAAPTFAVDEAHLRQADHMIDRAVTYLRAQQDNTTGGWAVNPQGPQLPGITALVVNGMIMSPDIDAHDPAINRAAEFILTFRQPDGGIYDKILANYNTSLCLSALSKLNTPEAVNAMSGAQSFLKSLQWSDDALEHAESGVVDAKHPFFGGAGYGSHSRPDMSNLNLMLQALHDSGLSASDEAFQRAQKFLERCQMLDTVNDMPYADGSEQGGFIYATSPDGDHIGDGETKAGTMMETLSDGTTASRLRAYGSMTYAGFKSYVYANLKRDDPRVTAAYDWIRANYTLEENPGVGTDGLYYYYVTFARALDAWGPQTIELQNPDGSTGDTRDWQNDLIDTLANLQNTDGSFKSVDDRWMENNPILITAYALLALQHAID
ncbi:MAG: hypothetical protein KDA20_07265 [Phycisphaerales bacterium]|nr:hypothetical protein [Phycisphaerales bacterium]